MEPETPVIKYAAIAVLVIIVCFGLGYFVLGPSARSSSDVRVVEAPPVVVNDPRPVATEASGGDAPVVVEERTAQKEAEERAAEEKRKKDEAERRERAKANREKRRREAEERKQQADAQNAATATSTTGEDDGDPRPVEAEELPKERGEPPIVAPGEEPAAAPESTPRPGRSETPRVSRPAPEPPAPAAPEPAPAGSPSVTPEPSPPSRSSQNNDRWYRVRVGGNFDSRTQAQNLAMELNGKGYATVIAPTRVKGKTVYRVQVNASRSERFAQEKASELRANGYDPTVSGGDE